VKLRLPVVVFGVLVVATVAAFFVTQHLKVTNPIVGGAPNPKLAAFDPVNGGKCGGANYRRDWISFYLDSRSDDVNVYVVNSSGEIVDQIASGVHMQADPPKRKSFFWNGRESNGSIAPDGSYRFLVALIHQDRQAEIGLPFKLDTIPPRPMVTSVSPTLIPASTGAVIRYKGTDVRGAPRLVKTFKVGPNKAVWDGTIHQLPAPAGTYLVGLKVADKACNVGSFPIGGAPLTQTPPPGTTPHAGVTVRYLAAQPPLAPAPAGSRALVYVDSRGHPYRWKLFQLGVRKPVSHGSSQSVGLRVRLPAEGLYELSIRSDGHRTTVPLLASIPPGAPHARVLVVLPALTWQGANQVDDNGDGFPDTLAADVPIRLDRVYASGLPAGIGDEAALLVYLAKHHLRYDLTTDVALAQGANPGLGGRRGVVFAGTEQWLPASLAPRLRRFVTGGGRVLSIGTGSLTRLSTVAQTSPGGTEAERPTARSAADLFGAHLGHVVTQRHPLLTLVNPPDGLHLFSQTSGAFAGFDSYQPIDSLAPPAKLESSAGVTPSSPSIAGFGYGHGVVVEIGLLGFTHSLKHDVDSQTLVNRLWTVLTR
jgi:hypothetical protein